MFSSPLNLLLSGQFIPFLSFIIAIIVAITIHEFAHAYAAHKLGDRTPGDQNRLSLNPIRHLDFLGSLLLVFIGFGWGKPVIFNPYNLKNQKWGPAIIAIAGPLSNLILVIIFGLLLKFLGSAGVFTAASDPLLVLIQAFFVINIILMVFNLIPIPPLDGSKILYALVPGITDETKVKLEQYGPFALLALLFLGGGFISWLFNIVLSFFAIILGL